MKTSAHVNDPTGNRLTLKADSGNFRPSDLNTSETESASRQDNLQQQQRCHQQPAVTGTGPRFSLLGSRYIAPNTSIARAVLMGNTVSQGDSSNVVSNIQEANRTSRWQPQHINGSTHPTAASNSNMQAQQAPRSMLSALLEDQDQHFQEPGMGHSRTEQETPNCTCDHVQHNNPVLGEEQPALSSSKHGEADLASGPPPTPPAHLGHSAPTIITTKPIRRRPLAAAPVMGTPPTGLLKCGCGVTDASFSIAQPPEAIVHQRRASSDMIQQEVSRLTNQFHRVRRCISSKELGTLAPPSGSPYIRMLNQKEELEVKMTERLRVMRDDMVLECTPSTSPQPDSSLLGRSSAAAAAEKKDVSNSSSKGSANKGKKKRANEDRNRRRAAHNRAVVEDLCEIVADLFVAESKLINPSAYGVSSRVERPQVLKSVQKFVAALPTRYALGVDTPSEVLLHMRLMAVARSDPSKCVIHIINLDNDSYWTDNDMKNSGNLRLVTMACADSNGLLEYITKLLGTGGSRVLDADVMLSSDRIVLDRFVVEMKGRLRLDKMANLIEAFLKRAKEKEEHDRLHQDDCSCQEGSQETSISASGTLYYNPKHQSTSNLGPRNLKEEIQGAVPLTEVLASPNQHEPVLDPQFATLKRHFSMPSELAGRDKPGLLENKILAPILDGSRNNRSLSPSDNYCPPAVSLQPRPDHEGATEASDPTASGVSVDNSQSMRHKRPLINRRGSSDLDRIGIEGESIDVDFVTVPSQETERHTSEHRIVPLIPFDELMLIETLGPGRVSTVYRAAWQNPSGVQMVALKVAMVNPETGDVSHIDELRREADIAARLKHPNVCDLAGVAADAECFCLAYDYCEGGSCLSLLSDTSRYYEYLPIALDVANGMAYLHSRNVIHRDLKPSNILLTRDHRAKIADFGMSVANAGQELTAETGTYRYMAPEVIRHESYSSNADVYSFGIFLWQLITRQVPFASMTPVQAAYAVAEGRRPEIPQNTPSRLRHIIEACWDQDSHKRPSFTYIAMALADYAKLSFSPASVGAQTLQIANEMLATVEGNSNVNVDFTTPVPDPTYLYDDSSDVGLEI